MKFIDNLVGKGLSWWVITQLITLNLAWMVTLAGPMASLIATLMAFGSLSSTNETTVMQATGISPLKLIFPVLVASGILCYGLVLFNNKVLPEANHRTRVLMTDIQKTRPTFVIEAGQFTDDISGYNMLVKKTYENSNKLEGVFIIDNSNPNSSNTLTADRGEINFSSDYTRIILDLYDGEIHQIGKKNTYNDYRTIKFSKHTVQIPAEGFGFNKSDDNSMSRGDRELSADSMRQIVNKIDQDFYRDINSSTMQAQMLALDYRNLKFDTTKLDTTQRLQNEQLIQTLDNRFKGLKMKLTSQMQVYKANQKQKDAYLVEIYKKYSIPFACVIFVLIGAPLGIITRRGGFGIAAGMSLGFFLLYWVFLIGGEKLADRELLSPFLSMWLANMLLGLAGIYLLFRNNINIKRFLKFKKT